MAPRSYSQRKRADTAEATRARIVDAAMELYRERGVRGATIAAIADRADVARGTILNHFGGADGLLDAVAQRVLETLDLPDERLLDGVPPGEPRIRAFVEAMVRFFERSTPWWQVFEPVMQRPELQAQEATYWAGLGRLQAAALGPGVTGDPEAMAAIGALIHPGTLGSFLWVLETAGLESEDRGRIVGDLVVAYLNRRPGVGPAIGSGG
ncbi:MAG: TetR/AcrR family transcriptional regulator [Chloroflexi bacterium]|nr:TetR/AcrR family transcriptional regulator [Chloroflexota bacterium]